MTNALPAPTREQEARYYWNVMKDFMGACREGRSMQQPEDPYDVQNVPALIREELEMLRDTCSSHRLRIIACRTLDMLPAPEAAEPVSAPADPEEAACPYSFRMTMQTSDGEWPAMEVHAILPVQAMQDIGRIYAEAVETYEAATAGA
ncbi:hypothetical protein [Methylopila sp. 73B]|uniref:hypothetical protein n=1 Tax=Methylopila sp. 73B TaxID=1120792 RepID=UPI0012DE7F07|nr:hypothetical protein [Methylopila sp. 73B]